MHYIMKKEAVGGRRRSPIFLENVPCNTKGKIQIILSGGNNNTHLISD